MAMVMGAQQALHSTAPLRSCLQAGSSSSGSWGCSDSSPSSCPIFRPSTSAAASSRGAVLGLSWTAQELSSTGVGASTQSRRSSGRERRLHGRRHGSLLGCRASFGGGALSPELKSALDNFIQSNKVVLFMKGNRNFPQCGFSNTCIQILNQCNVPYETVNILEDDSLRQGVKEYSSWPTYPQLYIDGEFFGGCDITIDAFKSGELQEVLDKALVS